MQTAERDLLIVAGATRYSNADIEKEVLRIVHLLTGVETLAYTRGVVELIEVNRNRITSKIFPLDRALRSKKLKPFQFIFHKN
ncbi:hypothetical protein [Compostibacter hankyongensis]|uniref:Uncharacterized protein n=1 Tax=Compostibacter hankyongensis TaxID=1007089 RepID=A0ABP8FCZ8_9BACT